MMKDRRIFVPLAALLAVVLFTGFADDSEPKTVSYEYRVMSLIEMFPDPSDDVKRKIADLMINVTMGGEPVGSQRTDMDAADFEEALNRLAGEGWEYVGTAAKSNYWIFRRPKP